jgi:hypothetical protein
VNQHQPCNITSGNLLNAEYYRMLRKLVDKYSSRKRHKVYKQYIYLYLTIKIFVDARCGTARPEPLHAMSASHAACLDKKKDRPWAGPAAGPLEALD